MLKNTQINRIATRTIALALGELNDKVVYVGGAVVSLYIDDNSADDVRPTKDIDISMEIVSLGELEKIRTQLTQKGFYQSSEDASFVPLKHPWHLPPETLYPHFSIKSMHNLPG